jgi:aminopeptidase N
MTNTMLKILIRLWHIPITYTTSSNTTNTLFWLHKQRQVQIQLNHLTPNHYLLVNPDQVGYYRVTYDDANWMLLAKALRSGNFEAFSPSTRAMLIGDAGTFTQMNLMNGRFFR